MSSLTGLVQAAEAGAQLPPLKVMAGGTLYFGYLGTRQQIEEARTKGIAEAIFNAQPKARSKDEADARYLTAMSEASALVANVSHGDAAFTMLNCRIFPPSGDGVEVAAVEIPFSAVSGSWFGAQKALRSGSNGTGLFAGVMVPLGE